MNHSDTNQSSFAFHTGRTVGKYRLESLIGRGGMAEVYKSTHPELGRPLAIKILHPFHTDIEGFVERFRQEAQAIAALRHPHIVQVFDFATTEDGLHYMVMEYIDGMALDAYLEQHPGPLPLPQALSLFRQVAEALHAAHEKGIIHRDVKPSNILIDRQGMVYLTDFGIAQILGAQRLTMSYMSPGTPSFMAPEQGTGQPITRAVDVYALGGLLYQLLAGRLPYADENPLAVIMRKSAQPPAPPSLFNSALSPEVDAVILQAMALQPQKRFADALAMRRALEKAMDGDAAVSHKQPGVLDTAVLPTWTLNKPDLPYYEIQELLSETPYVQRFVARSTALEQLCFLDVLRAPAQDAPDLAAQFRQHWQGLAQLSNPYLAAITNIDISLDNRPFAAFEYVAGKSLSKLLEEGTPMQPPDALRLVRRLAEALADAHEVGLVHQDLRPHHIFLRDEEQPLWVGLGGPLATAVHEDPYTAPEQQQGLPVSARSNMYALGVLLLELLTGQRAGARAVLRQEIPADVNAATQKLLRLCLQANPVQRPANWANFLALVDEALDEKETDAPDPKKRPFWQLAAVAFLAVALIGSLWAWASRPAAPAESRSTGRSAVAATTVAPETNNPPALSPNPDTTPLLALESGDFTITGPSPYRTFALDETVEFAWTWPAELAMGQQFVVYLTGRYGRFPAGVVTQSHGVGQYRLALPARDLAGEAGSYEWQVVLETTASGAELAASAPLPLNLTAQISGTDSTQGPPTVETGIRISQIVYNPPGEDLDGEFVRLVNQGEEAIELTGWLLQDNARSPHVFTFPTFTLAAGATVQVWVGSGQNDAANLYWGFGAPVWNNDGDTATLLTNSGAVAAQCAYPGGSTDFNCP